MAGFKYPQLDFIDPHFRCTEACPNEATVSGPRDELIKDARQRFEEEPESYYPHIYGEHEIGGTNVMFISPFPAETLLGYTKDLGTDPLPQNTWRVLSKIPHIAVFAGASMGALWWLTSRRDEVRAYEAAQKKRRRGATPQHNGQES